MERNQLHVYQNYCVDFIEEHPASILILEMGLGKSISALTTILDLMFDSFTVSRTLIIAPLRVAANVWPSEWQKWEHTHFLRMPVVTGSEKKRIEALKQPADVYVINRENVKWLVDLYRQDWPFDLVCIDELSSFKNSRSQRWRALRQVRSRITHIIGLTGTPASNGLMDLFGEVGIVDDGQQLGRFITHYRELYFKPESMNPLTHVVYSYTSLPDAEQRIYRKISDIAVP